ncbi:MAG: cell division FtsA domain-containing protein [Oscillospiraceae bacterium]|nr:cell division FtsA domain-containing protein [Oscillospiraceae bacterium]
MNDNVQNGARLQSENEVFALDIGTRTVVGVLGHVSDDTFVVDDCCSIPHKSRAMTDGQIEDIDEVAKIAGKVKAQLEEKNNITLTEVSIAAAGRALKTCRTKASIDIEDKGYINDEMLKSLEMDAIADAQDSLDEKSSEGSSFYCVGNTVVKYFLDDYPIKSLKGHRGKTASAEILAAFLPSPVVESLYSVMDKIGLSVRSLTLEPIAAMNVIIPAEVRLINIALVDIGAGTSDIAISRDGSIVAYAMATIAGDEITEEIIRKYLVDFNTAEEMKQSASGETIKYRNILGMEQTVETSAFFESLFPTVDLLADTIAANILEANGGEAPAAVFLVGGGSQVPELSKYVAQKLGIPEERAAVGGRQFMRNVDTGSVEINGPEFVTPIGIGVTATIQRGYDFSTITLNGEKIRIFDTKKITVVDLLRIAGYKPNQIIGRSGRNLTYILNGERKSAAGTLAVPAEITVNGKAAAIDTPVKQGDTVTFKEAENGVNAQLSISDIAGDVTERRISIDGMEYPFGTAALVNEKRVSSDYKIQNYDDISISTVETLGDLMLSLPFDCNGIVFMKNGKKLRFDYLLCDGDKLETCDKTAFEEMESSRKRTQPKPVQPAAEKPQEKPSAEKPAEEQENVAEAPDVGAPITVILNGRPTLLERRSSPHEFLELMALANLDTNNPPPGMNIVISLNGKDVSFMDPIKEGDVAVIRWE